MKHDDVVLLTMWIGKFRGSLKAVALMILARWDVALSRPARVVPVLSKNRCALYCLTL